MSTTENNYQETDLGNVSLNPRGEYDPGASYEYLDTVSYQGGSYTCLAELGTTITGIAPDPGRNTDAWQMLTLPGDLKPEYIAMHDDTVNHARQAESSRLAAELAQQAAEDAQADIQQLHTDTRQAETEAGQSRDSAAGYAQSADASRKAAAESEQNINAQVTDFDTKVSESVTQAQEEIATTRQQAIRAVASQQVTSIQAVKDQTASYITEKETSAKTEIGNCTSEKIAEINKKASEANTTLANTIADGTSLKTQLETTISTADTSKKNLDASNTAAGKTKTALDTSNTTATKTKADLDASNTTASEAKTGLDATNKTAADLVASLGDKITEGTQVKTDIQTTGETAMSNLQAEAKKQQEYIKTSIDDTLSISGKAADAAVTGKKIDSLKEDLGEKETVLTDMQKKMSDSNSNDGFLLCDLNGNIVGHIASFEVWNNEPYNKKYGWGGHPYGNGKLPPYSKIVGVLEADLLSVRGGKGRWNKDDTGNFKHGGHLFEGWNAEEDARLTFGIGTKNKDISWIQTFHAATQEGTDSGSYYCVTKVGSDIDNQGMNFMPSITQSKSLFSLKVGDNLSLNSKHIQKLVDTGELVDWEYNKTDMIPYGTMYFDYTKDKVRVYTRTGGWKYLKFEEEV